MYKRQPFDLVLVAVKAQQIDDSLDLVAPVVDERTTFLSVLNGLDSERVIGERFAPEQVLLCIALAMDSDRDGTAVRYTSPGRLEIGDGPATRTGDGSPSERLVAVQELLDRASLAWEAPADIEHQMWWKFLVNVGGNQASAVTGATYGQLREPGPARELMDALQQEVVAVANAEGVDLGPEDVRRWYAVLEGQPPRGADLDAPGRHGRPPDRGRRLRRTGGRARGEARPPHPLQPVHALAARGVVPGERGAGRRIDPRALTPWRVERS